MIMVMLCMVCAFRWDRSEIRNVQIHLATYYPENEWAKKTPAEVGVDAAS